MATSTTNIVSSLNAGSGVDIKALAQSLVDAEKAPQADLIQKRIDKSNAKISGYGAVSFALDTLKSAFDKLRDVSDFSSMGITNTQPQAFSVTADATARTGSYDVTVNAVATGQRSVSAATYSSSSQSLNGGAPINMTLTVAGTGHGISVAAGDDTPAGIVVAINEADIGISAELINTGSGYRVVLTGPEGADQAFSLSVGQGDFSGSPYGSALNGGQPMTVQVTQTNGESTTLTIDPDTLQSLHDTLNASGDTTVEAMFLGDGSIYFFGGTVKDVTGFTLDESPLQSAQDASITVNGLTITRGSNEISDAVPGLTFKLYAQTTGNARVELSRDSGSVKANVQNLVTAYNDFADTLDVLGDRDSEVELYGGALAGDSFLVSLRSQIRAMITDTSDSAGDNISAFRDIGVSFDRYGNMTFDEGKFDDAIANHYDEVVTMMTADTEAQSVYSTAPAGVAGAAYKNIDEMLRSTGTIATRSRNADSEVSRYEERMSDLEDRMSRLLDRYLKQFSIMDSIVGTLNSTRTGLTSTFEGMMATYTK